jgi:hypothetical protein
MNHYNANVSPVAGGEREMKVLKEMNELAEFRQKGE